MHTLKNPRLFMLSCLVVSLSLSTGVHAREKHARALQVPSSVRGFVGGESHDAYRFHGARGEHVGIRLASLRASAEGAEMIVSDSPTFGDAEPALGGTLSEDGAAWDGTLRRSGWLYIYVVAHPSAHYRLTIEHAARH